jgi:hypothetical protein
LRPGASCVSGLTIAPGAVRRKADGKCGHEILTRALWDAVTGAIPEIRIEIHPVEGRNREPISISSKAKRAVASPSGLGAGNGKSINLSVSMVGMTMVSSVRSIMYNYNAACQRRPHHHFVRHRSADCLFLPGRAVIDDTGYLFLSTFLVTSTSSETILPEKATS